MTEFIINDNGPTHSWQTSVSFGLIATAVVMKTFLFFFAPPCPAGLRVSVEVREDVISMK